MLEEQAEVIYKQRANEILREEKSKSKNYYYKTKEYKYFEDILSEEDFKKAIRVRNRKRARRRRCFNKFEPIVELYENLYFDKGIYCNIVFGTCTFDNNAMKWKEETRTKKVNKWLKEHFVIALANIDYGEKTEREHHHFIALTFETIEKNGKKSKTGYEMYEIKDKKNYSLGFEPNLELITDGRNNRKPTNYMVKLNYHSNKFSTKNRRIRLIKTDFEIPKKAKKLNEYLKEKFKR